MNQWVAFNIPQDLYGSQDYYHFNRKRNLMEATDDERFEILNNK
jgi:hypothetical protein